ncbi:hypothetical protein TrVE_jg4830 [Triparma verrucosa]|uniref:HP domain-containing protein n=1 Tax=Triparma verrucosa TaxID=1606542 RepID=A0A9W7BYY8_9STRA|nr:hypothetical protein TrVE_jg4830 [Triparma verrucosa]
MSTFASQQLPPPRSPPPLSSIILQSILSTPKPEVLVTLINAHHSGQIHLHDSTLSSLRKKIAERFPLMSARYDHVTLRAALGKAYFDRLLTLQTSRETEVRKFRSKTRSGSELPPNLTGWESVDVSNGGNLPYRALIQGSVYPKGVKVDRRESYLCDDEFFEVFKMGKGEFYKLDKYVRTRIKKEKKLW